MQSRVVEVMTAHACLDLPDCSYSRGKNVGLHHRKEMDRKIWMTPSSCSLLESHTSMLSNRAYRSWTLNDVVMFGFQLFSVHAYTVKFGDGSFS